MEPLEVEYRGCEFVWSGPVCEVADQGATLTLWVAAPPPAAVTVVSGGRLAGGEPVAVDGGQRIRVEVPAEDGELVVEASGPGVRGRWTLPVIVRAEPAWYAAATEACNGGELDRCDRLAAGYIGDADPCSRSLALGLVARIAQRRGQPDAAAEAARGALAGAAECGWSDQQVWEGSYLAWLLRQRGETAAARRLLGSLPLEGMQQPVQHVVRLGRARSRRDVGDLRGALEELGKALAAARRLGVANHQLAAGQRHAMVLQMLGRSAESGAELAELLRLAEESEEPLDPCHAGILHSSLAWARLLAREAGGEAPDPLPALESSRRIMEAECAWRRDTLTNSHLNAALAHLQRGEVETARAALAAARAALDAEPEIHPPRIHFWAVDLEARAARSAGDLGRAQELYLGLAAAAEAAASPDAAWRAAVGLARTYEDAGRGEEALAAFARAERVIEGWSLQVPLHEGRSLFLAQREGATRRQLDLLLARGRVEEAVAAARRAISRVPRSLAATVGSQRLAPEEREGWERRVEDLLAERDALEHEVWSLYRQLSGAELDTALAALAERRRSIVGRLDGAARSLGEELRPAAPASGELIVVLHPLVGGWMVAAVDGSGVVAWRRVPVDGDESVAPRAEALLAPLTAVIEEAERIRVVAHAAAAARDLELAPVAGRPLVARGPVVHSLDLPAAAARAPAGGELALLVGDPGRDLPAARREIAEVVRQLERRGRSRRLERLVGAAAAGPAVREALPVATLFHYAGHAAFAGPGGWQSALPLGRGTRLTVGDVLALPRVPDRVVLSGCESGGAADGARAAAAMGLAQAFLVAGASEVVAAVRPVRDASAAALVIRLYEELSSREELGAALGRAQLALAGEQPEEDWGAFRALVR